MELAQAYSDVTMATIRNLEALLLGDQIKGYSVERSADGAECCISCHPPITEIIRIKSVEDWDAFRDVTGRLAA